MEGHLISCLGVANSQFCLLSLCPPRSDGARLDWCRLKPRMGSDTAGRASWGVQVSSHVSRSWLHSVTPGAVMGRRSVPVGFSSQEEAWGIARALINDPAAELRRPRGAWPPQFSSFVFISDASVPTNSYLELNCTRWCFWPEWGWGWGPTPVLLFCFCLHGSKRALGNHWGLWGRDKKPRVRRQNAEEERTCRPGTFGRISEENFL